MKPTPKLSYAVRVTMGFFLCYALFAAVIAPFVRKSLTPPHQAEFRQIEIQTLRYFDEHGAMPDDIRFLTPDLQALFADPESGFSWDMTSHEFRHDYRGVYPVNITASHYLTLGLLRGEAGATGRTITPENVRLNTPIFKAAGLL